MATKKTAKKAAKKAAKQLPSETKPEETGLSTNVNFADDAGSGSENMTKDDLTIPRLSILQALSPQVKKGEKRIEGAEEGDIFNNVLEEVTSGDDGLLVVPITYRSTFIEWQTRESGGGFVADHGFDKSVINACQKDDKGRMINSDGNQIVQTAEYYVFVVNPETGEYYPVVISMSGTQLKHSRRFNTVINTRRVPNPNGQGTFNPAMFYAAYRFNTQPEQNDKGSWFAWDITHESDVIELPQGEDIYLAARSFRDQIKDGAVKAANDGSAIEDDDDTPM